MHCATQPRNICETYARYLENAVSFRWCLQSCSVKAEWKSEETFHEKNSGYAIIAEVAEKSFTYKFHKVTETHLL